MLNLSKADYGFLKKKGKMLTEAFYEYMDEHVQLPASLNMAIFPNDFFDAAFYLTLPYLFKPVFQERNGRFSKEICISGYFYFRYLLCMDDLNDQDDLDAEGNRTDNQSLLIMRSHIYHEEALKILGHYFGKKPEFWAYWKRRNKEFLGSILLDKHFNPKMSFEQYCQLAIGKCAFAKVAVDAFYVRHQDKTDAYEALIKSMDLFSIARCIQDDLEDFKKDIQFEKNNYAIIRLHQWMIKEGIKWEEQEHKALEKYLFVSGEAEQLLTICGEYYQKAFEIIEPWKELLPEYVKILQTLHNQINIFKVNIRAYRVSTFTQAMISQKPQKKKLSLDAAIELSHHFISKLQNDDGSWNEISNMQGLSNVWSTGYIASFLNEDDQCLIKATDFLSNHKQGQLWGYNTDWSADYDSTTCVLMALNQSDKRIEDYLPLWFEGQKGDGGFSTYHEQDELLFGRLGLKKRQVTGWTSQHICVSALAFYFLSHLEDLSPYKKRYEQLVDYLLEAQSKKHVWKPYWWTSFIYPTTFIIQGLLRDKARFADQINLSVESLMSHQHEDGSFSCEVLNEKSVFYTALVLDTITADLDLSRRYSKEITMMKDFILKNQFDDGGFKGTHFLVIPNPNQKNWSAKKAEFKRNIAGGGNTITGEISNLFTTAVSHRALRRFQKQTTEAV